MLGMILDKTVHKSYERGLFGNVPQNFKKFQVVFLFYGTLPSNPLS